MKYQKFYVSLLVGCFLNGPYLSADELQTSKVKCTKVGVLARFKQKYSQSEFRYGIEIYEGVRAASLYLKRSKSCYTLEKLDIGYTYKNIPWIIEKASNQGFKYFIGLGLSPQAKTAIPALRKTRSLLFSPTASNNDLNGPDIPIVLMYPSNNKITTELAKYIRDKEASVQILSLFSSKRGVAREYSYLFRGKMDGEKIDRFTPYGLRSSLQDLSVLNQIKNKEKFTHVIVPFLERNSINIVNYFLKNKNEFPNVRAFIGTNAWGNYFEVLDNLAISKFQAIVPIVYNLDLKTPVNDQIRRLVRHDKLKNKLTHLGAFSFDSLLLLNRMRKTCGDEKIAIDLSQCLKFVDPRELSTGAFESFDIHRLQRKIIVKKVALGG